MASKATVAKKVKLQIGDGETPTEGFDTIAEIKSISGPNESAAQVDCTSMDSDALEFKQGLKDGGEVSFEYNFVGDDASQASLRSDFEAGTVRNFKIDCNDATATLTVPSKYAFAAIVTKLGNNFQANNIITGSCTLKISGAVTFTPRASA